MLARARRELAGDHGAHRGRACLAVLRGRMGSGVLRHHARTQRFSAALFGRLRSPFGRHAETMDQRSCRAGQRHRSPHDDSRDRLPGCAARFRQTPRRRALGLIPMSTVSLEGVSRSFGDFKAGDGIDLRVPEGEFLTLLGPSGCGKTTTLRMVAGLERNDTGSIVIGGRVVSDAPAGLFVPPDLRKLGMVFQSYAIWPHMTVFDNVAYPLSVRHVAKGEIRERVQKALTLVEMDRFAD